MSKFSESYKAFVYTSDKEKMLVLDVTSNFLKYRQNTIFWLKWRILFSSPALFPFLHT